MSDPTAILTVTVHLVHRVLRAPLDLLDRPELAGGHRPGSSGPDRDRGAISLEQVLWFVAAGVSVAVVAAILWSQIRDQANTPIDSPSAP